MAEKNRHPATGYTPEGYAVDMVPVQDKQGKQLNVAAYSADDKKAIAGALATCMVTQRTYGKQAADLQPTVNAFIAILAPYHPAADVVEAIKQHLLKFDNFPTPADIHKQLASEQAYDRAIYQRIVATLRNGGHLEQHEWQYIKGFEKQEGLTHG